MSEWAMKRFWQAASVRQGESGYKILLDGRPVKTPAKNPLTLPTLTMANSVASEWQAQVEMVDPRSMPWTRSANAAIDKVAIEPANVADHLLGYAATDLLCYRADGPAALIYRQSMVWDEMLAWAEETFGAKLIVTQGVMPIEQAGSDIERLGGAMRGMTAFQLMGFSDLVTLTGSYVLALAAISRRDTPERLWQASRVDEIWQIEQWGEDEEASEHAEIKRNAFIHAYDFFHAA